MLLHLHNLHLHNPATEGLLLLALLLLFITYFWHRAADKGLEAQSRAGMPSNADARWLLRQYHISKLALVTFACVAAALALFDALLTFQAPIEALLAH